eukprot:TRINITY_DN75035_c0_g1_i1.p1 TRINITY_DN75035_c0_g1~~TRINITY_DN75035_c0_g1_i1.p1  ORF type:complete len:252 (-),score=10.12 TRINITY_DN75035_c0_g1_i1:190-945(-)
MQTSVHARPRKATSALSNAAEEAASPTSMMHNPNVSRKYNIEYGSLEAALAKNSSLDEQFRNFTRSWGSGSNDPHSPATGKVTPTQKFSHTSPLSPGAANSASISASQEQSTPIASPQTSTPSRIRPASSPVSTTTVPHTISRPHSAAPVVGGTSSHAEALTIGASRLNKGWWDKRDDPVALKVKPKPPLFRIRPKVLGDPSPDKWHIGERSGLTDKIELQLNQCRKDMKVAQTKALHAVINLEQDFMKTL